MYNPNPVNPTMPAPMMHMQLQAPGTQHSNYPPTNVTGMPGPGTNYPSANPSMPSPTSRAPYQPQQPVPSSHQQPNYPPPANPTAFPSQRQMPTTNGYSAPGQAPPQMHPSNPQPPQQQPQQIPGYPGMPSHPGGFPSNSMQHHAASPVPQMTQPMPQQIPQQQQQQQQPHQMSPTPSSQFNAVSPVAPVQRPATVPPTPSFPPVDTSQIAPIVNSVISRLLSLQLPPAEIKKVQDIDARLKILYGRVAANELSQSTLQELSAMCAAMSAEQYTAAQRHHLQLVKTEWSTNQDWLLPFKTLLVLAKKFLGGQ
jgi:hypothetical protein